MRLIRSIRMGLLVLVPACGVLLMVGGCDGGSDQKTSQVAPPTPEQLDSMKKSEEYAKSLAGKK